MRGCLFVLALAAVVVTAAAWFGAPPLTSAVIASILENSGYHAADSTITASANPPVRLLFGHADTVTISGRGVTWRTFRAASVDLTLGDVNLFGRTAGAIHGTISGAELQASGTVVPTANVAIDGSGSEATAVIHLAGATVDRLVRSGFSKETGTPPTTIALVAPDTLRVATSGSTIEGGLAIDTAGALVLLTRLGSTEIFSFDPSFPIRITGVQIMGADLELTGTLDAEALLHG
jgi:hypothetical protein